MELCFASLVFILLQCLVVGVRAADCAPTSKSFTIRTAQDVTDIASCGTFTGNIVVAADGPEEIALDALTTVSGNIDVENVANLHSLSSKSLEAVSSFTLNNLPKLSNLSFPALKNFSSLKWYDLPALEESTIATGTIDGEIQEITIVYTALKSLDWLKWPIGSQLNISSNANLQSFDIPYNTINAGSALTFSNNAALESIDLSNLAGIYGGLQISGNEKLTSAPFTKVETINGFVQMSGAFTNVSMPALNQINGALRIESTGDISSLCGSLEEKSSLTGHYDCTSKAQSSTPATPTNASATNTMVATMPAQPTSGPSSGSNGLSTGIKVGLAIAALVFTIAILIAAFFYFRRRSRAKVREISPSSHADSASPGPKSPSVELIISEAPTTSSSWPKELEAGQRRVEVGGKETQELPGVMPRELDAKHGASELVTPHSPAWSVGSDVPLVRHELPG